MVNLLRPRRLRPLPLTRIADLLGEPLAPGGGDGPLVGGVTLDSRSVRPGDLYAALPGLRTHGARYAGQARDAGAVAILTDPAGADLITREGTVGLPLLVVDEPREVLGGVAALVHDTASLPFPILGITGTNGKTTTAYLLHSALVALGLRVGLIGTVETRIGEERVRSVRTTPESPDVHALLATMAESHIDCCVMEVSSHALTLHRVDGVRYDLALFTNLSQDHLDFHHDMESYYRAKAALFTPDRARQALVCVDDDWGLRLAREATIPVTTLTTRPGRDADWSVRPGPQDPSAFLLTGDGQEFSLRSALPGDFNSANTAMAAVALLLLGHDTGRATSAVLTDPHVPGRMEVVPDDGSDPMVRALVDYAHSPEAIRAAMTALRPTTSGTLVCVTGAGGDRDRDKREAMGAAAAGLADIVIVTDDNPRSEDPAAIRCRVRRGAEEEAARRGSEVRILEVGDRRLAIREAVRLARASGPGATVAVVGKGHEWGQEVAGEVHPFDDRAELATALAHDGQPPSEPLEGVVHGSRASRPDAPETDEGVS